MLIIIVLLLLDFILFRGAITQFIFAIAFLALVYVVIPGAILLGLYGLIS